MQRKNRLIALTGMIIIGVASMMLSATAQTTVTTTGGTIGQVPVFTGTTGGSFTLGDSFLSQTSTCQSGETAPCQRLTFSGHYANHPIVVLCCGLFALGTGATNGGMYVTVSQPTGTAPNQTYYTTGYRFGQDSVQFQRGMFYDQLSGRVSLINTDAQNAAVSTTISERLTVLPNGKIGIGTTTPGKQLDILGTIRTSAVGSDIGGVVYPDGTQQITAWTGVLCGGDYAEAVSGKGSRKAYEPGDVLVIGDGAEGEVEKSAEPYSTMVAGIFATKPGVIGQREKLIKEAAEAIPMAMVGIVPTKVTTENGPIHRGDLLVTSSSTGYAMKGTDRSRLVGAVIGKAMGSLDLGTGVIEVLVTLQ